jgi:hypothetical protein
LLPITNQDVSGAPAIPQRFVLGRIFGGLPGNYNATTTACCTICQFRENDHLISAVLADVYAGAGRGATDSMDIAFAPYVSEFLMLVDRTYRFTMVFHTFLASRL